MSALLLIFLLLPFATTAQIPLSETFSYLNSGELSPYIAEYSATYRLLPIVTSPFQLCFFNTTPGSFHLALGMGTPNSQSPIRFVWIANPSRPVGENAAFSLSADGELRLTDADGSLVFSSSTAGKGVARFQLLPNGNIVLVDSQESFLWQSFEHPADTLLVGQSLPAGEKLVSRWPAEKYSLEADSSGLGLYVETEASGSVLYSTGEGRLRLVDRGRVEAVVFACRPETGNASVYELTLEFNPFIRKVSLALTKYNATLSFIRVEADGNLVAYTYNDKADSGDWEKTFLLFSNDKGWESDCRRPEKCGTLGVCDREMCVACPTANGLDGWSDGCEPPRRKCEGRGFYKVEGVESFVSRFGSAFEGSEGAKLCFTKCSRECGCAGVLFWQKEIKCWMVPAMKSPAIGTLEKVEDENHVMWIKQ